MSLRFWNWTRIYDRNTESSLMHLRYGCLTSSSSMVLMISIGCPFNTSEAATTRLLPLTLSVYSSSMYEVHFFGIHHLSTPKSNHLPCLVISQVSAQRPISSLDLNTGFFSNDSLLPTRLLVLTLRISYSPQLCRTPMTPVRSCH
jgi:hypothetical protein